MILGGNNEPCGGGRRGMMKTLSRCVRPDGCDPGRGAELSFQDHHHRRAAGPGHAGAPAGTAVQREVGASRRWSEPARGQQFDRGGVRLKVGRPHIVLGRTAPFVANPSLYPKLLLVCGQELTITGLVVHQPRADRQPWCRPAVQGPARDGEGASRARSTTARSGSAPSGHRGSWSCCRTCRAPDFRRCTTRAPRQH